MKALKQIINEPAKQKKGYQYSGNKLVNEIEKPKKKFFMFENDDIENTYLSDFEFRLLLKLYSMKDGTSVDNKLLAKKFKKSIITINRTLESLIQKEYIHISTYKQLIIRRISNMESLKPILTLKMMFNKYVQEIEENKK